jgi:hypothetical protein
MEAVDVRKILDLVPELLDVPYSRIWTVYDKEDDDLIIKYENGSVVGSAVLNASRGRAGHGAA